MKETLISLLDFSKISKQPNQLIVDLLSPSLIQRIARFLLARKARSLSPKEGLKLLSEFDRSVYHLQGEIATAYGKGVHVKHRLTSYHKFFSSRINESDVVLDIGCGNGALTYEIAETTRAHVTGVDIKESNIKLAKQLHPSEHVTYLQGDALTDIKEQQFDVVVLSNIMEHIRDRVAFLQTIQKVTNAKRFIFRVPNYERDWRVPLKKELGVEWRLDITHEIEHTLEEFIEEIHQSGLIIQHLESRWGEIWSEAKKA